MKFTSWCKGVNVAQEAKKQNQDQQQINREMLLKLLSSMIYLCRQGHAVRWHKMTAEIFINYYSFAENLVGSEDDIHQSRHSKRIHEYSFKSCIAKHFKLNQRSKVLQHYWR